MNEVQDKRPRRSPWPQTAPEIALDGLQWLGIACLVLIALSAHGLTAPLAGGRLADTQLLRSNQYFLSMLALVSLIEYPAMLVLMRSLYMKPPRPEQAGTPLKLRAAFAVTPWIYLLVLLFKAP